MGDSRIQSLRNIVFAGPSASGKTSLLESILFEVGAVHARGSVEQKNTFSDSTDEEKASGHSIYSTFAYIEDKETKINLIDSPGHPDFVGQVAQAMPAVESMCLVLSATDSLDPYAIRLMEYAKKLNLCRAIVINKIDAENAQCERLLTQIRETFGKECLPVNLPASNAKEVRDVFFHRDGDSDLGPISEAHQRIIDQVIEIDDTLTEQYLTNGENFDPQALHDVFESSLRSGHLIPICFVSARGVHDINKSVGIRELLDFFENLLPSPLEGNFRGFVKGEFGSEQLHVTPDASLHALGHVPLVKYDPFRGKIAICRVHQGTLQGASQLFVGTPGEGESKKAFRPGHLYRMHGSELVELKEALPGDIVAMTRVTDIHRNAVLHSHHEEDFITFECIELAKPLVGRAIGVKKKADEQKFADAVARIAEEDAALRVERDQVTNQILIYGVGELHLRTALEKLALKGNLELDISVPKISYRETLRKNAEGHCRHKKQTGGAGQFAEVFLRVEPMERGTGFEFVDDVVGGVIPNQFIPAVEKGIRSALQEGALAGFPIQDVRVTVYDGKDHPVDSKEIAFFTAGKKAFLEAFLKASPCLLEPIMKATIVAPASSLGEITGNVVSKRGRIVDTNVDDSQRGVITAEVPLSALQNYQSELRGLTSGQGSFTMEFLRYDFVPESLSQELIASANAQS